MCSGCQESEEEGCCTDRLMGPKNLKTIMGVGSQDMAHSNRWNNLVLPRDTSEQRLPLPAGGNVITPTNVAVAFLWLSSLRSILCEYARLK